MLFSLGRPPDGWSILHGDPVIFGLLLDCLISPLGFEGIEAGLSLPKLIITMQQAEIWGMTQEVEKLALSINKYIARRILYRNPFTSDAQGDMDHNYFVFRSEELYRSWMLLEQFSTLRCHIRTEELVALYSFIIPADIIPALTTDFQERFNQLLDLSLALRPLTPDIEFHSWWLKYFCSSGYLDYIWMRDEDAMANVLDLISRS